ncbi:hypothetical protein [Sporolactobacillus laevolacticus]|uniref:Uncharacterized protein n=1 Tax=Sporolactobacillus laevolacticus DSM 442 TaxID=1395513 RepID=V6IYL5_9BACL|nr:hypothetical protein [Sporolactobacillus laevolacticus]EST12495.1 hypothetical protein P343_07420 [Sporolactobacillus laevolacticus DSM 442]
MAVWFALFKKELRLGSMGFLIFLILQVFLMGVGVYFNYRSGSNAAMAIMGVTLTLSLLLYVPVYLLFNVIQERKTFHLWMQNPLSAWSMLLAKLSGSLIYFTGSLVVIGTYTWISLIRIIDGSEGFSLFRVAILATLVLYWTAVGGGVNFLFLWTILRMMQSRIGKLAWVVLIIGIGVYTYIDTKLYQSGVIDALTHWGRIPQSFFYHFLVPNGSTVPSGYLFKPSANGSFSVDTVYIGSFVFDLLITGILFLITTWLMDHELEAS